MYRLAADRFMVTVNAGNIDKDWAWVTEHGGRARLAGATFRLRRRSSPCRARAPRTLVRRLADGDIAPIGYYRFALRRGGGAPALVSRTGYTGEDGFELYVAADDAEKCGASRLRGRP